MTNSINALGNLAPPIIKDAASSSIENVKGSFGGILSDMVSQVNSSQINGDQVMQGLHSGDVNHLHEVMIAVEEADVSLRMLVQMRNKALAAYEEIMRMQI